MKVLSFMKHLQKYKKNNEKNLPLHPFNNEGFISDTNSDTQNIKTNFFINYKDLGELTSMFQ